MNGWMRTDFDFGNPMRWLEVGQRDLLVWENVKGMVLDHQNDPETLKHRLMGFITSQRPDLANGIVLAIRFGMDRGFSWEILMVHPSFSAAPDGILPKRIPLVAPGYVQVPSGPDEPVRFASIGDAHKLAARVEVDASKVKDEMEKWYSGLHRYSDLMGIPRLGDSDVSGDDEPDQPTVR